MDFHESDWRGKASFGARLRGANGAFFLVMRTTFAAPNGARDDQGIRHFFDAGKRPGASTALLCADGLRACLERLFSQKTWMPTVGAVHDYFLKRR